MQTYNNPKKVQWEELVCRPSLGQSDLRTVCKSIFDAIARNGDQALADYTQQFDGVEARSLVCSPQNTTLDAELKEAIDVAYENIAKFHKAQVSSKEPEVVETMPGVLCWREARPIEIIGLYIPGGSAPLVSTVLMLGVPAQLAGCKEVILATPPDKDGKVNPAIMYAAQKIGATKVVCAGGAQAIAAFALGTSSVPKVDKIFGPGNQYVTAAKQLAGEYGVAIDMPAGPSEVMVLADDTANPAFVAADLLSQAEHGPDSQVVLVALSRATINAVQDQLNKQLVNLPRAATAKAALSKSLCVYFDSLDQAMDFVNSYAPEHLILSVKNPEQAARTVVNAGSVFLGNYSPESAGDYASGTNHTLPTNGWAKSYGGVSVDNFVKQVTFQKLSKESLEALAPTIITLAQAEGLEAHAAAVSIRLPKENKVQ